MLEVPFVRFCRIAVDERHFAVCVRSCRAIHSGENAGLNDGESFFRAIREVLSGFLAIQTVEKFPSGVTEIEKRFSIFILEVAMIVGNSEAPGLIGQQARRAELQNERE